MHEWTSTCCTQDHPLAIGEGQTISAPHMHAICLELLEPQLQPGARVLDVGAGERLGAGFLGGLGVCLCVLRVGLCHVQFGFGLQNAQRMCWSGDCTVSA